VKLLGSLVGEEPRLARKLLEPLATIVQNTQAKSLLYEAVYTITLALPYARKADGSVPKSVPAIVQVCANTLGSFVKELDQNLKYLGLVGFVSLMSSHPKAVIEHKEMILQCLCDDDITIRTRALELLTGMATKRNLIELVTQLMQHIQLAEGPYRDELISKVILMCSRDKYGMLSDFAWYISILVTLASVRGTVHGHLVARQMTDVTLRVLPVREFSVYKMLGIIIGFEKVLSKGHDTMYEILPAAAWVLGEYSASIHDLVAQRNQGQLSGLNCAGYAGLYHATISAMMSSFSLTLRGRTPAIYVQSALKIFAAACCSNSISDSELVACLDVLRESLPIWAESVDVEVQERSTTFYHCLDSLGLFSAAIFRKPKGKTENFEENRTMLIHENTDIFDLGLPNGDLPTLEKNSDLIQLSKKDPIAEKCRSVAITLSSIFIPEPMKPINIKAQKRIVPAQSIDLEKPFDISIFDLLLKQDTPMTSDGKKRRIYMDEVDFVKYREHVASSCNNNQLSSLGITSSLESDSENSSSNIPLKTSKKVRNTTSVGNGNRAGAAQYYLPGDNFPQQVETQQPTASNRHGFQEIQIGDFGNDFDIFDAKKKKKKVKQKKNKKNKADDALNNMFPNVSGDHVAFYGSDDEEEYVGQAQLSARKTGVGKEFLGLAMVDLTTPLGDDEVMPKSEHRQVPSKSMVREDNISSKKSTTRTKGREKKKKKKLSKTNKKEVANSHMYDTQDLLDFGMSSFPESASNPSSMVASNDFGLLDPTLVAEVTSPVSGGGLTQQTVLKIPVAPPSDNVTIVSSTKKMKRPWISGSVKANQAQGSAEIDWTDVSLSFRVFDASNKVGGNVTAAVVVLKVVNNSHFDLISVSVKLKGVNKEVVMGDIASGMSAESSTKSKVGPFIYDVNHDTSLYIRGSLNSSGSSVPCKLSLPSSMLLLPVNGLSFNSMMEELSSNSWRSKSIKVIVSIAADAVLLSLCAFLRGVIVESCVESAMNGAIAAQSKRGSHVRALVKVKKHNSGSCSVKIDVKCTDSTLLKSLAADMENLQL